MYFQKMGIEFSFVDFTNVQAIEDAVRPNTKLIFSETPVNPIVKLCDVAAISKVAKARGILHACDSTFATPYILRPLDLGADMTVQSTTKYYDQAFVQRKLLCLLKQKPDCDGHNMTVGGAVACSSLELRDKIAFCQNMLGNVIFGDVFFHPGDMSCF